MFEPFDGSCFEHELSKVCQYVTIYNKVASGFKYASKKSAQFYIKKCITWPKKFGKGR
jgi:hypothetical protein